VKTGQKQIAPDNGRYFFDGGLNSKFEKSIIGDNESPDCQNVVFTNGAVGTRQGTTKVNTAAIGAYVGDGLYTRHDNSGAQTMIAFAGGSAYTLAGTTFTTIASAQSVFTAGIRVCATEYQNHMFIGNGGVTPYKYNGVAFTRHGVYPATTTSTVASNAVGVLNGDYRYKIVNVNSQLVESDVSPITTTFAAANATLRITSIPVAPQSYGVAARRVYRNKTSASGTYYLVATINDNTTTQFDDNVADASLGATAPSDHGVPPKYSVVCFHRDRIHCNDPANPNFGWYSDLAEPYTFGALNFRRFGDNTSDLLRCIAVDGENIVYFGDRSIMLVYMPSTDDAEWVNVRVKSDYGCKSPFGIVRYKNGLLFPAIQENKFVGFAHLIGDVIAPSATLLTVANAGSELISDKIEPNILDSSSSEVTKLSAYVYQNTAYFSFYDSSSSTSNDTMMYFDFSISDASRKTPYAWAPWTGLFVGQMTEYSGNMYYIDSRAQGFVYKMNAGVYSDSGTAIDSYWWTKEFGGNKGDFNFHKDFRYANILVDLAGTYQMDVASRVDSDVGSGNATTIDLDPGGSLWGSMVWGVDEWGGGNSQGEFRVDLGALSGKRLQIKFSNQNLADQRFKVHSMNYLFNTKGFR
jgi:hypothetical protein